MSKGSSPRPFNVSNQEYSSRWDAIFGRDNEKKNETQAPMAIDRPSASCDVGGSDNRITGTGQAENS